MIIKSLKLAPFAGINELEVAFLPGLNVLYGPNEAGKSTVVEGLYAALFQQIKLKRSVKADQEFHRRARRYPSGDHAHLQVTFKAEEGDYHLTKHWQQGNSYINMANGQSTMAEEEVVREKMDAFLLYGAQTYANVLFAKQSTFQKTLEELHEDTDTSNTVDEILKKAVMQLDGVSVEALRRKLELHIEQLGKRWDRQESRPENNRTIQNPYKTGIGEVLKAYYKKESLRMELQAVIKGEASMESLGNEIQATHQAMEDTVRLLAAYELVEPQVIKRETIEIKQLQLKKEYRQLFEINKDWPVKEAEKNRVQAQMPVLKEKIGLLKAEVEQIYQYQLLEQDRQLVAKAEELKTKMDKTAKDIDQLAYVTETLVQELEEQEKKLRHAETAMEAATLVAILDKAAAPVSITAGFHDPVTLQEGQQITANGSLRFEMGERGNALSFRVNAGELDFEQVKSDHAAAAARKGDILEQLKASTVEEASHILREKKAIEQTHQQLQQTYTSVVGDKNMDALRYILEKTKGSSVRSIKDVTLELEQREKEWQELQHQITMLESQLNQWTKDYKNHDSLLETLIETKAEIKQHETELEKLATLPEGFQDSTDFRNHVAQLRTNKQMLSDRLYEKKQALTELQYSLPDDSSEELTRALTDAEDDFLKMKRQLNRLVIIRETLERVVDRLDKDSARPLEESFRHYLGFITDNRYQSVSLDESFQIEIQQHEKDSIVPSLFSAGTYDSVALAFRFALIDQMFPEKETVIVLDDCLVNLDPKRKARTIQLIQEKAEQHQIIFTTCQPETADQLGGHVIRLGA